MHHAHNADPAKGPVCSHLVTDAMNTAWGLTTKRTDKIMGTPFVTREGISATEAFMAAWRGGLVVVCSIAPVRAVAKRQSAESRAESMAWAEAHLRAEDRERGAA